MNLVAICNIFKGLTGVQDVKILKQMELVRSHLTFIFMKEVQRQRKTGACAQISDIHSHSNNTVTLRTQ